MTKQNIVPLADKLDKWDGAKQPLDAIKLMSDQITMVARDAMATVPVDHPTRVYLEEPSERVLAYLTPLLGLQPIEFGNGKVRWKVALSDETDSIDPVHARSVNNYIAKALQDLLWKKDARVVVDSAPVVPLKPNVIAFDPA